MNSEKSIPKLINRSTQSALESSSPGYVCHIQRRDLSKSGDPLQQDVHMLDLGVNPDGCAPEVANRLAEASNASSLRRRLSDYPKPHRSGLKDKLGHLHQIPAENILFSAGLEQMIGSISSAILETGDRSLCLRPGFFVFENYSRRAGGDPVFLELREDESFCWSGRTLDAFLCMVETHRPKIVWLASPNNPTGRAIPESILERIIKRSRSGDFILVVDEAYGEYIDPLYGVRSASKHLQDTENLVVLRTFSKAFGLADLRLGYAMSTNPVLRQAIRLQLTNYPCSQFALDAAECALDHLDYLEETRNKNNRRMVSLLSLVRRIDSVHCIPSDCNIVMLRCDKLSAKQLEEALKLRGIFSAPIGDDSSTEHHVRVTLGRDESMLALTKALEEIGATQVSAAPSSSNAETMQAKTAGERM